MKIVMLATSKLHPYENNARTHKPKQIDQIKSSIKEFGFNNPILIDDDNEIIAGHGRLLAAIELGLNKVPVVRLSHLDDIQRKAFALADNRIALNAGWDEETLAKELEALVGSDYDVTGLGFDTQELAALLTEPPADELEADTPPTPAAPITQAGQVWQLGRHRLMCGDSTNAAQVNKLMAGAKANMIFTDPPYGMALETDYSKQNNSTQKTFEKAVRNNHSAVIGDGDDFKPELITAIFDNFSYCKEIFIFGADYYAELIPERKAGSWAVWDKVTREDGEVSNTEKFHGSNFELVWSKSKHKREIARVMWKGAAGHGTEERQHPTQKPVRLAKWFFDKWGKDGDKVVDLYGGAGFTMLACEQTGRTCYTMELSPSYCDVIKTRWETLTGHKATL